MALGDMAMALAKAHSAEDMEGCLDAVAAQIREAIAPPAKGRSRTHSPEALNVRLVACITCVFISSRMMATRYASSAFSKQLGGT